MVHMDNEVTAVFWLRSYLQDQHTHARIDAASLDFDRFGVDLCGHFGYSEQQHSLVWDPRGLVRGLDCEYVVRGRNGWIAALILMQNQESVLEKGLPCHFHIVNYIEFGKRHTCGLEIQAHSGMIYRDAQKAVSSKLRGAN